MNLSGQERQLLGCGTFSLRRNYNDEENPIGVRLVELKLVTRDEEAVMAGEDRYIITELGKNVLNPERQITSQEFEEQVVLGTDTVAGALDQIAQDETGAEEGKDDDE